MERDSTEKRSWELINIIHNTLYNDMKNSIEVLSRAFRCFSLFKGLARIFIAIPILFLLNWSCDDTTAFGFLISNDIFITVLNSEGEDILDPNHPSAIDLTQIRVYYELDGVKTEINGGTQTYRLVDPSEFSNHYRILLFLNTAENNSEMEDDSEVTTTYIEWNPDRTDVIKSQIRRRDFGILNDKIWLNDELICDVNVDPGNCYVTLVVD